MERMKIVKDAFEYSLGYAFTLRDNNFTVRSKMQKRAFQDGGLDISDGRIDFRTIRIMGMIQGTSRSNYLTNIRAFETAINKRDYQLFFGDPATYDHYVNIEKPLKIRVTPIEGQDYEASMIRASLLAADPYWYYKTDDDTTITVDSSPKSGTVANNGNVDAYPVITVTADTTITSLQIENETDVPEGESDGLQFTYADNAFFNTDELIIDCQAGTVERESSNTIRFFEGAFLKLLPGNNTITVTCQTSGATTVKFDYAKRFLSP